jgi:hypothetical protein
MPTVDQTGGNPVRPLDQPPATARQADGLRLPKSMEVSMKCGTIAVALAVFGALPANAAISLLKVPAACGTMEEVTTFLSLKMPGPAEIGSGGDKRGVTIATLLSGNGYWALVATVSSDQVCVVASGREWTVGPVQAKSY